MTASPDRFILFEGDHSVQFHPSVASRPEHLHQDRNLDGTGLGKKSFTVILPNPGVLQVDDRHSKYAIKRLIDRPNPRHQLLFQGNGGHRLTAEECTPAWEQEEKQLHRRVIYLYHVN